LVEVEAFLAQAIELAQAMEPELEFYVDHLYRNSDTKVDFRKRLPHTPYRAQQPS
jgi:hypothetical protein